MLLFGLTTAFLLDMAESWRKLADSAPDKVDRDGCSGTPVNED